MGSHKTQGPSVEGPCASPALQNIPPGCFGWVARTSPWYRPVGLFSSKRLSAVCHQKTRRPSSRVPPSVQSARLPSFFFYRKKKEAKKNAPSGKVFRSLRGATKGTAFGNRKPLKRLDRNFTGLRPQWLRLQVVTVAFLLG